MQTAAGLSGGFFIADKFFTVPDTKESFINRRALFNN